MKICSLKKKKAGHMTGLYILERETRFELATSTLARLHSTTELFPLGDMTTIGRRKFFLERETRFELATSTLARLHSTTELFPPGKKADPKVGRYSLERETRFELATSTLARLHSTTELFPQIWRRHPDLNRRMEVLQTSALPLGYVASFGAGNEI